MKNRLFSILIVLFIALSFTFNSLAQTPQDDPQQGDFPDGAEVRYGPGLGLISDIKFSPDGTRLAVAGSVGIWLLDVQTGDKLVQFIKTGFMDSAVTIAFSPDGNMLVGSMEDNTVRLWDVHTGRNLRTFKGRSRNWAGYVAFSPDGKTIVNGGWNKTLSLLDPNTGKTLRTFTRHTKKICSVAFSPDGKTIASAGGDKTVCLWDVYTGKNLRTLTGHTDTIQCVAFSPDGKTIASGSSDDTLRLWDTHTGQHLRTITEYVSSRSNIAFSPDNKMIAIIGIDCDIIHLWDVNTGQLLRKITSPFIPPSSLSIGYLVAFSPDGRMIVSAGTFEVHLWDANTGQLLRKLISHPRGTKLSLQRSTNR